MITADEARLLTSTASEGIRQRKQKEFEKNCEEMLNIIEERIKKACSKGDTCINIATKDSSMLSQFAGGNFVDDFFRAHKKDIEEAGYIVDVCKYTKLIPRFLYTIKWTNKGE